MKLNERLERAAPNVISSVKDCSPSQYPSFVAMDKDVMEKTTILGRRFETSILMYDVNKCDCCGCVKPNHNDPIFPKDPILKRKSFVNQLHDAFHCTCEGICQGSQFFCADRKTHIDWYYKHHDNKYPWHVIRGCRQESPNSSLCENCYNEIGSKNVDGELLFLFYF